MTRKDLEAIHDRCSVMIAARKNLAIASHLHETIDEIADCYGISAADRAIMRPKSLEMMFSGLHSIRELAVGSAKTGAAAKAFGAVKESGISAATLRALTSAARLAAKTAVTKIKNPKVAGVVVLGTAAAGGAAWGGAKVFGSAADSFNQACFDHQLRQVEEFSSPANK